jgi:hypothetical protein
MLNIASAAGADAEVELTRDDGRERKIILTVFAAFIG